MNTGLIECGPRVVTGEEQLRLHVLVIYEDFRTGLQARRVLEEVARRLDFEVDLVLTLWRLDTLLEPEMFQQASAEAEAANIVLLFGCGKRELPAAVKQWFLNWLANRGGEPSALAVSLDSTARNIPSEIETLDALRAAAEAEGVDVFLPLREFEDAQHHTETVSTVPEKPLRRLEVEYNQHWGINE